MNDIFPKLIPKLAREVGLDVASQVINIFGVMGGQIGAVTGNPELFVDNVHLSDAGNAVFADAVFRSIAKELQTADLEATAAVGQVQASNGNGHKP